MDEAKPNPDNTPSSSRPHSDTDQTLSGNLSSAPKNQPPKESFAPGSLLAERFRVVRFLARGGMGEVYEAEDTELNERVALKTVRFEMAESEHAAERFKREIQFARRVTHPNVCRTFDVFRHTAEDESGVAKQTLLVSMELLNGETLEHRVQRQGKLTPEECLPIVTQMAAGLQAAHEAGVIHRDFKSSNVMLLASNNVTNSLRAVITDFGLARAEISSGDSLTKSLDVVGTPAYMAPEQLDGGEITARTDLYAFGVVLFEMLTGKRPFFGESALSTALKRLTTDAPSPRLAVPELDAKWESVVLKCLERDPSKRFGSAMEVVETLKGERPVVRNVEESSDSQEAKSKWTIAAALAAVLLIVVATLWIRGKNEKSQTPSATASTVASPARTSVAVLGFRDLQSKDGNSPLGEILSEGLWSQLDTDAIRFVAPASVNEMRSSLGLRELPSSLTKEQLAKIGQYLGCDVVVTGSYRKDESVKPATVDWNIHLQRVDSKDSGGSVQQTGKENEVNQMVARAGRLLRAQLGVELNPTEAARIDGSLSADPVALRHFSEALEKQRMFDLLGAAKSLENAVAADPKFALAHSALAEAWSELGFEEKAREEAKKALDLASQFSAESRGLVTARYYEMAREWDKATQQYASLWTLYGDNPEYGLLLAKSQIDSGNPQAGLTTIEQVRRKKLPLGLAARVSLAAAEANDSLGNSREQQAAATDAAEKAKTLDSKLLLARARIQQCWALLNGGQMEQARPLCDEALKLNQDSGDPLGLARAANNVANGYWKAGDAARAKPLYQQALGITQTIGDKLDESGALNNLANILDSQGDFEGAKTAYLKSIDVAKERGDKSGMALAQQNLAIAYFSRGNQADGLRLFNAAIRTSREIGDKQTEARALNNLCAISLQAGDVPRAAASCEESLKLRRQLEDQGDLARSLVNTGDVLTAQGNLDEARRNYESALKIQEHLGQKGDAAYSRILLASNALERDQVEESTKLARQAAGEMAAQKDPEGEGQARLVLAQGLLLKGDAAQAGKENDAAANLAQESANKVLQFELKLLGARIAAQSGDVAKALSDVRRISQDATKAGLHSVALEARLTAAQIQTKSGNKSAGIAAARALAEEARKKGFGLIANKAAALG